MKRRCLCDCHAPPDALFRSDGVSTSSVVEAAVACRTCINHHTPVFLMPDPVFFEKEEWVDPPSPPNPDDNWKSRGWLN